MPLDCEMLDSLLESDDAFFARYGFVNDGGEYLTPSAEYLLKEKQRLLDHPEVYPFAVDYLIVVKEHKTVIGSIDFKYLPDEQGVTEIGYGMQPKYEGHGYMTEAVLAMIGLAKENGVTTIVADTLPDNVKSQHVLTRCGFTFTKRENEMLWFSRSFQSGETTCEQRVLTIEQIKEAIRPIMKKHGVMNAYLFGSYARGEANEGSDVDIYCDGGDVDTLWQHSAFEEELRQALGKDVDVITIGSRMDDYFRRQLENDMIKIC